MKDSLARGLSVTRQIHVDRERAIDSMGEKVRVYATPMLVLDIDRISRELLPMDVEITVTVSEVKGRAISLEVEGRDSIEPICRGRHNRFVVGVETTLARLAAKAQKAGLA